MRTKICIYKQSEFTQNREEKQVFYGKVTEKEKLHVIGIVDASYKSDEKSIGGILIMIADEKMTKVSPIM